MSDARRVLIVLIGLMADSTAQWTGELPYGHSAAGFQIVGNSFTVGDNEREIEGLGPLDVSTTRGAVRLSASSESTRGGAVTGVGGHNAATAVLTAKSPEICSIIRRLGGSADKVTLDPGCVVQFGPRSANHLNALLVRLPH